MGRASRKLKTNSHGLVFWSYEGHRNRGMWVMYPRVGYLNVRRNRDIRRPRSKVLRGGGHFYAVLCLFPPNVMSAPLRIQPATMSLEGQSATERATKAFQSNSNEFTWAHTAISQLYLMIRSNQVQNCHFPVMALLLHELP